MKFRGHAHRSLDEKGRLILPPEFRDKVLEESGEGEVTLTIFDGCVVGFPPSEWAMIEREMGKIKNPSRKLRNFIRILVSGSERVSMDRQGRITIPSHLRKSGRLDRDVVLAGVGDRFEVWDKERFEEMLAQDYDDVSQDLSDSDINLPF